MSQLISPFKFLPIRNIVLNKIQSSNYLTFRVSRYFSSKGDGDQDPKDASNAVSDSSSAKNDLKPSSKEALNEDSKKTKAKKKLFSLLSEFKVETPKGDKGATNLKLAKAVKRPTKQERFKDMKPLTPQEKLLEAVKNVAENVSGDPNQTQMELNGRLSSLNLVDGQNEVEAVPEDLTDVDAEMKDNIMSSVKDVASTVTGVKNIDSIKSELTQRLMRLSVEDKLSMPTKSIDLLKGMKVEEKSKAKTAGDQQDLQISRQAQLPQRLPSKRSTVNMFRSPPLDIFTINESKVEEKNTVWNTLEEKNLKLLVQFAPSNGFEEMIMWTEQGKHWKFPIDNEAEMGAEENVGFHEHVFLEHHLHGFPTKGPIRQFMELVCVGLSKNPYITVERKIENIDWFRNYFKGKEEVLKRYNILG